MTIQGQTETGRVLEERARYVARGVAVAPIVVERAEGARIWDVDGRSYVDFAGGIGCQNLGHGSHAVVSAIHDQVDRYLHQCFMVATYEPYVAVCRRLAELSPCAGEEQHSVLVNSGTFSGLHSETARVTMAEAAERAGFGRARIRYRLRDWTITRQRYWGTPVPMVHCPRCGVVPVPEDQLPVLLPLGIAITDSNGSPWR